MSEEQKPQSDELLVDDAVSQATESQVQPTIRTGNSNPGQAMAAKMQQQAEERLDEDTKSMNLSLSKMFRLYALPLFIVIIFGAIVFTLIIPGISAIFVSLGQADRLDEQVLSMTERLRDLESLANDEQSIDGNLAAVDIIIPERITEVVNFQQKISRIAKTEYSLKVSQAESGETLLSSAVESPDNPAAEALSIIEIPSVFSMTGSLQNIQGFISAIQQTDDFVIIGEMELSSNEDTSTTPIQNLEFGEWRLDITLVKYQFPVPNSNNNLNDIYSQVPPNVEINQEVLDYVKNKVALGRNTF